MVGVRSPVRAVRLMFVCEAVSLHARSVSLVCDCAVVICSEARQCVTASVDFAVQHVRSASDGSATPQSLTAGECFSHTAGGTRNGSQ